MRGAARFAGLAALAAVVLVLPRFLSITYTFDVARAGIFLIAILGLNVLTGYTGQISLGHGAFMAIGGYTTAILVANHGFKDLWTIPLAGLLAGAAGFLFGIPALRLSGLYLSLATFGLAVATPAVLLRFDNFTGGSTGIQLFGVKGLTGAVAGVHVFGRTLGFEDWLYYLTSAIAAVLVLGAWLLLRGRVGRAFRAIRDSEIAAAASGVNLAAYKTLAFGLSAFCAGVAGSLFTMAAFIASPGSFQVTLSLQLLVGAAVAGLGSLWGLVLGALFIEFLPILAPHVSHSPGLPSVIYGVALVLVMFVLPTGSGGLLRSLLLPLTRRL